MAEHREAVVVGIVVVPLVAVWVDEEDVVGKRRVVIDDVAEQESVSLRSIQDGRRDPIRTSDRPYSLCPCSWVP